MNWYGENYYNELKIEKLTIIELPDIYERSKITLNFNEQLKNKIASLEIPNIKYLDITTFTYEPNLKRIRDEFFSKNDHHSFSRSMYYGAIINNYLISLQGV